MDSHHHLFCGCSFMFTQVLLVPLFEDLGLYLTTCITYSVNLLNSLWERQLFVIWVYWGRGAVRGIF